MILLHPSSNRSASSDTPSLQCSNALYCRAFSFLYSFCCVFYRFAICAAFSFSSLLLGQSLYQCSTPSHSKYLILFSCAFLLIEHASSFFGSTSCGATTCTTLSLLFFHFLGHFFHWCPSSLYLKHCIASSFFLSLSCLLISTPHLITLLDNISNLFLGTDVLFPSSFLFLQL